MQTSPFCRSTSLRAEGKQANLEEQKHLDTDQMKKAWKKRRRIDGREITVVEKEGRLGKETPREYKYTIRSERTTAETRRKLTMKTKR